VLYIVGDHCAEEYRPYRAELEAMIRDRGLHGVTLTGWRGDVHDIVSLMDVFVLPSHAEGVPKSVIEAMALGKPVVTTTVGSIPDLVEDGVTGLLVAPRDPDALADCLVRLVRDAALRDRLGRAARQQVLRDGSIKDNIAGLERLYENLCAKPAAPGRFTERPNGAPV
jgi:glycosyltransferase involved in cell wall biosynthesis